MPDASLAVLDPAIFLRGICAPRISNPLSNWRDGKFRLVLTRRMLRHLLGLLRDIGLSKASLERWAIWLSHNEKVILLPDGDPSNDLRLEYLEAARRSGAMRIITPDESAFESFSANEVRIERAGVE